MSWRLFWSPSAIASLEKLPWRHAARVDNALQELIRTGQGDVFRLRSDDPITARLRVSPYVIRFTSDPRDRIVWVWFVYSV